MTELLDEVDIANELGVDPDDLDLTGLVMTGGHPYILLTLMEPETGGVDVSHIGIDPAVIPAALREIADLLEAADA